MQKLLKSEPDGAKVERKVFACSQRRVSAQTAVRVQVRISKKLYAVEVLCKIDPKAKGMVCQLARIQFHCC